MLKSGLFPSNRMLLNTAPPLRSEYERSAAPRRRALRGCTEFVRWYIIGLVLWGALGSGALLAVAVLVQPDPANILILGLDRRPGESLISRSDTMILARVDPAGPAINLLSIPRDLWVTLPDGGPNRINTAHRFAELNDAGSGPAAAMQTVAANFGVSVDHYVRIDFEGFVRIIDAMGGITINVENNFVDYQYPTYDNGTMVVSFEAGVQHMDGERALQYARIRHGSSDFVRAARQQQIVAAVARRVLQPGAWLRLPALVGAFSTAVDTDMGFLEAVRFAPTLVRVGPDAITRWVIEGEMVQPYKTPGGAAVQLPVWEQIDPVLRDYFGKP
ncbi:MAG: LCP family protein [Methyloligellaceae bacterium]